MRKGNVWVPSDAPRADPDAQRDEEGPVGAKMALTLNAESFPERYYH